MINVQKIQLKKKMMEYVHVYITILIIQICWNVLKKMKHVKKKDIIILI